MQPRPSILLMLDPNAENQAMWNLRRLVVFVAWSSIALALLVARDAAAFPSLVDQIPNGDLNSCDNCHIGKPNDGVFNAFGNAWLAAGSWQASLATADSDGDSFSNGWELQDPTGSWTTDQGPPGVASLVTFPGDALSIPPKILLDVLLLEHEEDQGANGSSHFMVENSGGLVLDYSVAEAEDWMSLDPVSGQVAAGDPAAQVDVLFQTQALDPGFYEGTITVSATGVINSPQGVAVELIVLPEPGVTALGLAALSSLALLARVCGRA